MKLLKKILVVVDFGDNAKQVVDQALYLARAFSSEVALLHVIPFSISKHCDLNNLLHPATELLKTYSAMFEEAGIPVTISHVTCGEPFEDILDQSEQLQVNLIVMGEKDYEPEKNRDLGVTAWRVIRKSQKPVWVVKRQAGLPIKAILCPVDFSEGSGRALKSALFLARTYQVKLHVLHVEDKAYPLPGHYEPLAKAEKMKVVPKQEADRFELFLKQFDFHQVDWEKHCIPGDPRDAILNRADLLKTNMIMLGSIGQNDSRKIMIGAVAEHVVKNARQHIISFKNEHAIKLEIADTLTDIRDQFKQGKLLLESGLAEEAITIFEYCLKEDLMFIPAWEGLAEAYHRFGQKDKACDALNNIEKIKKMFWEKKVEFELKNKFWKKVN